MTHVSAGTTRSAGGQINAASSAGNPRLMSLDVLRGFDMFWILGADAVVLALAEMSHAAPFRVLAAQMDHKVWAGFAFYDLIFPTFVFVSGVSMVFSLTRALERDSRGTVIRRVLIRAAILFALGIVYNSAWPPGMRIVGVLQRIALAYAATAILFCFCRRRTCSAIGVALLLGYWALLAFVPVRDVTLTEEAVATTLGTPTPTAAQVRQLYDATQTTVTGSYLRGRNLPNHVDYLWLPGDMYRKYWDPEGILSTFPAIATCLLGLMAGRQLQRTDRLSAQKLKWLTVAGVTCLTLGWLWHPVFPVVKDLWSSSFVLVAGGWSLLLLAFFYYIVDIRQARGAWCQPFLWIGLNPILLYMVSSLVGFDEISRRLGGGSVAGWLNGLCPGLGNLVVAVIALGVILGLARFLHRKQIYLRV